MIVGGLDFRVKVTTNARRVWTSAAALDQYDQRRKCLVLTLEKAVRRAARRRFPADTTTTFTLHLFP